jgi:hypothetical protein
VGTDTVAYEVAVDMFGVVGMNVVFLRIKRIRAVFISEK